MHGQTDGKFFSRMITVGFIVAMLAVCVALLSQGGGLAFADVSVPVETTQVASAQ